jgi:hypothetical protein
MLVRRLFNRFAEIENAGAEPDVDAISPAINAIRSVVKALSEQ